MSSGLGVLASVSRAQLETFAVMALAAAACALPGCYLVLRRMALMSDAISHVVLFGIAVAFLATGSLESPLLMLGAAATGLLMVALTEALSRTRLLKRDAAIGITFPALFSLGVLLISHNAANVHLDTDAVLLGQVELASLNRWQTATLDFGPKGLWVMGAALVLNAGFIAVFYKELKLATFDGALAAAFGFAPVVLNYALMGLVSVTAVAAFDVVGSVLVVALMVVPAATAYLLCHRLGSMLAMALGFAVGGSALGFAAALALDSNVAGSVAAAQAVLFTGVWIAAPQQGLLAGLARRRAVRQQFYDSMLAIHLLNHEGLPEAALECTPAHLATELAWAPGSIERTIDRSAARGLISLQDGRLHLTELGRALAREAITR